MTRPRAHFLLTGLALLLIAVASIVSAARMAPERGEMDRAVSAAVFGLHVDDLCGEDSHHDHRCDFCRLLDDPRSPAHAAIALALRPQDLWRPILAQLQPARGAPARHAPRAPPALV